MAEALVSRERLWRGDLPEICIKTGDPATGTVAARFTHLPPWTYLLLLPGIVPFLIAVLFATERISGQLPITAAALHRYHAHTRWMWGSWALVVLGVAASALAQEPWLLSASAVGVLLLVVTEVRRANDWVAVRPLRDTPLVELRRVHPAFATAVAQATPGRP